MLYCMQVRVGSEKTTIEECKKVIPSSLLNDIFAPMRKESFKYNGSWTEKEKILFPGYVFVETDDISKLHYELRRITRFTSLIKAGTVPITVTEEDLYLINKLSDKSGVMEISRGYIIGDKIQIVEGPLIGLEGLIVKIDRHKRRAILETHLFGRTQSIEVGLEIVQKIKE
ncbi:MAG: antiterminator LoaP, partial [Clostridia bacterium]|nr:antiterminator LoaP [Clostridia bacterium]